jgi:STE24 endopeptidase
VAKFALNLVFVFFLAVFFFGSLQASPQSPPSTVTSEQPSASTATQSPASPGAQSQPRNKITAYTLPPDLYRKARNRGRIGFASRIFSFFYGLLVLWFILRRKLSAKYREWAERFSRHRFLQALVFTAFLILTIGVLQLPIDIFHESVSKLYKISVQPWSSWTADWAKAQLLTIVIGSLLVWILYAVIGRSPHR